MSNITTWKYRLPQHENIIYHIKQIFLILKTTIWLYHQIDTPKTTLQIFTWITIHHTVILCEPWRQHYTSDSKSMRFHLVRLLIIPINKNYMAGIQISQCIRLWCIFICYTTVNPSKAIHSKIKLSSILKSPYDSHFQGWNYSFIYTTKITRQNYHLN